MKYFSILEPWLEPKYKLIAQPPPPVSDYDPGDTAQREGMFSVAAYVLMKQGLMGWTEYDSIRSRYSKVLQLLDDPNHPGLIRRYPDPSYWGGLSDRLSRDQSVPNVVAMGFMDRTALKRFFFAHLRHGALLFTTNTRRNWSTKENHGQPNSPESKPLTKWQKFVLRFGVPTVNVKGYYNHNWKMPDLTFGSFHACYIRAFKAKWAYPLLLILDLDLLGGAIAKLFYARDPKSNDDLNHIICQMQANLVMPTPWSRLARWIYRFRKFPANSGDAKNSAQACLNAYFRGTNPGPKLEEVWKEITEAYF